MEEKAKKKVVTRRNNTPPQKPKEVVDPAALHEAGHAAACISLGIEFREVTLKSAKNGNGIVSEVARLLNDALAIGVFTPELERLSTNIIIMAFAGPVCDALFIGRRHFEIGDYDDLDTVLDIVENRFSNNSVRLAFTHYCEAEAFALFEDDTRLWRYTHLLAKELAKKKKLSFEQCLEFYNQEYFVES